MFIYDPAIKWFKNIMLTITLNQAIMLKKLNSQLIRQRLEDLRK